MVKSNKTKAPEKYNKNEVQQKYVEYQMIEQQIMQIQKQLQQIEAQTVELKRLHAAIGEFAGIDSGKEVLVPFSPGVYAKAEIKDTKKLLVNIGSNVVVSKSVDDTKDLIDSQVKEIELTRRKLAQDLTAFTLQAQMLGQEINDLSK